MNRSSKRRSARKDWTPRSMALHEAGHAVVAMACGAVVADIWIDVESGNGACETVLVGHNDPLVHGLISWGGAIAEGVDYLNEDDAAPFKGFDFCNRSVLTLRELTIRLLKRFMAAVVAIANHLEKSHRMTGLTAKRLALKACPALRKEVVTFERSIIAEARNLRDNGESLGIVKAKV